ncbi:MAG: response regulator transcription factor [Clostridiales bacterium]|jgi:DNA-binding response OmpR family regulator|nr:response regulator transcription factor [Clostridiales bacterium]
MRTLLIVEDELNILENHRRFFTDNGYRVLTAETAAKARKCLAAHTPDAILLDIMLPDGNGLDILQEIRSPNSAISSLNSSLIKLPIIILTAWGKPQDISRGYRLGATAYLSKPFDYEAVLAVLDNIFTTQERMPESIVRGGLTLDLFSDRALLYGADLLLSPKEFSLLYFFVQHEDEMISAARLYEHVWGQPLSGSTRALENMIYRLRKAIESSGYAIVTKRGRGYCFENENNTG